MLKKFLLTSAAGFVVVAGALYVGAHAARAADDTPRFVFRYAPGLLTVASSGEVIDPDGPGEPSGGGTTEPENPGDGTGEREDESTQPSNIDLSAPILSHLDMNHNGYADAGDILRLRVVARNGGTAPAEGVRIGLTWPNGDQEHVDSCDLGTLTPGLGRICERDFYLTPGFVGALGEPDAIATFSGFGSLIGLGDEAYPADTHRVESNEISFLLPAPVTGDHIAVSAPTLALLDADGDGSGDVGEVVRMTFKATNIGSGPAFAVAFTARFPSTSADVRTCDFANIAAAASVNCQVNFVLTQELLDSLGEPGAAVSLDASASLVAVNGLTYGEGEYLQAFGPVGFTLPTLELVAYLRLTYSGGWIFECRTEWSPQFLADNLEMTLILWNRVSKIFEVPGMEFKHTAPAALSMRSSWFQISTANYGTMTANVGAFLTPTGDPRGKQIQPSDGKACPTGKANIVAHGDLTTSHRIEIESAEIIERIE